MLNVILNVSENMYRRTVPMRYAAVRPVFGRLGHDSKINISALII